MIDAGTVELLGLAALGVAYFLISVLRSSYAELNPVAATRVLSSRGFTPREGEAPSDMPPVMRTTFDLLHHLVVIAASALWFGYLVSIGSARPFLYGAAALGAAMVVLQGMARALSLANPEMAFSASLAIIGIFYHLSRPIIAPVVWTIRRMRRAEEERRIADGDTETTEEQIEAFIDAGQKEGIIEAEESKLIRQVVEFHDSVVREVMTPRTDVVALASGSTVAQTREVFARQRHSRLPVYREQIDNVEGIITLKDLVASWGRLPDNAPVDSLLLPAYFVPETKQVSDLLKEFQARRIQMAIVVDEYGGTAGLVTIEDLLEQLVGDIQEEHEREEAAVVQEGEGIYLAQGTASLDELRSVLGVEVEGEGFETVSGLIYSILGRIPTQGEVVKADTRKIDQVRVTRLVETSAQ